MKLSIIPSEEYPSHVIEIKDWLAEAKGFYNQFKSPVTILRETERAYYIRFEKSQEEQWLPKSQCKIIKRVEEKLSSF